MATWQKPIASALSLRANFAWTFAANIVNAASQWAMLAVLAKLGDADTVGKFYLGLSIAAPVVAVTALQLRSLQATDVTHEFAFPHYFGAQIILSSLGILLIAGLAILGQKEGETIVVVLFVGAAKVFDSVSEVIRGLFQRYERMDLCGISLMLKGLGGLVVLSLVFWITKRLSLGTVALAVTGIAVFVLYDLLFAGKIQTRASDLSGGTERLAPSLDLRVFWIVSCRALPLTLGMFLLTLQSNIPRYVLESTRGEAALGYYGAMAYLPAVGTLVVSALAQSASPRLATLYANNLRQYRRLVGKLLLLSFMMGILFIAAVAAFGRTVMTLLYRAEYADYPTEMLLLSVAGAINFITFFCGHALVATRVFRSQLTAGILTCAASSVCALWLVPRHGILGGAITMVITSVITLVCYSIGLWRRLQCGGTVRARAA